MRCFESCIGAFLLESALFICLRKQRTLTNRSSDIAIDIQHGIYYNQSIAMMHASLLKAVRGCAALPGIGSTTGAAAIASLHHPTIASSDEASANRFVYVHTGNIKLEPSSTRFMLPGPLRQSPPLSVPPFQQQAYSSTTGHSSVHDELLAAGERHSVDDVLSFVERCGEGMSEEDVEVALGLLARSAQELSEEEQAELGWKLQGSKTFQAVLGKWLSGWPNPRCPVCRALPH